MKSMLLFLIFLLPLSAWAAQLRVTIYEVEISESLTEDVMVKTNEGDVLWVRPDKLDLIDILQKAVITRHVLGLDIDDKRTIINAWKIRRTFKEPMSYAATDTKNLRYSPTVFTSISSLRTAFRTMDRRSRRASQCYDRAYVWGYDLWKDESVNSMKLFLFFTNKYIREYRYKWWFHVSPMSNVAEQEYVLDRLFTKGPLRPQTWTNIFMRNNAVCKSVESYFDYFKDDPNEYCFLIRSTMYYLGPNALKRLDQGYVRTKWNESTMRTSRRRAFY